MRCPNCGEGKLFASYLKLAPRCDKCGADFAAADPGDGPAVFVILIVGAIVVPLLFILQFGLDAPEWLALSITFAATIGLCLYLLPLFKSVLFALQWKHKARQATNDDVAGS
ncbi:MAG TPA: DUF983 domain-containing protein [Caulobacterales bacterium]|nr:DUF983 domain-containing protein [Caulobacterales bacterium]